MRKDSSKYAPLPLAACAVDVCSARASSAAQARAQAERAVRNIDSRLCAAQQDECALRGEEQGTQRRPGQHSWRSCALLPPPPLQPSQWRRSPPRITAVSLPRHSRLAPSASLSHFFALRSLCLFAALVFIERGSRVLYSRFWAPTACASARALTRPPVGAVGLLWCSLGCSLLFAVGAL
jgi:hypothetical protein